MKRIAMVARLDFEHYDGRSIARGQFFEALPIEAAALTRSGKARFASQDEQIQTARPPAPAVKDMTAEKPKPQRRPRKPRNTTNRRDISKAPITK